MARAPRPRLPRTTLDIAELLGTVQLFSGLTLQQRELLARTMVPRKVRRGDIVFTHGGPGDALYVVARGSVLIHRTGRGGDRRAMTVIQG